MHHLAQQLHQNHVTPAIGDGNLDQRSQHQEVAEWCAIVHHQRQGQIFAIIQTVLHYR